MAHERLTFTDIVAVTKQRPRMNFDSQVAISGDRGVGKSNLAIRIARECDSAFTLSSNMVWSAKDLELLIRDLPPFSAIIVDEAIAVLFRRDHMKIENKQVLRLIDICRKRNLVIIWCVPSFFALDSHFVSTQVHLWLHVFERGRANIYTPLKGRKWGYLADPWLRRENAKRGIGASYKKSPNWNGDFTFEKLEPDVEAEYLRICAVKAALAHKYEEDVAPLKRRGRPVGSKNRRKVEA